MIKQLLFICLSVFITSQTFAQAGPTNDNAYRNYIRTTGYSYGYDHTPDNSANRAFFILRGQVDQNDGMIPCLFDTTTGVGYDPLASDAFNSSFGPPFINLNPRDRVVNASSISTTEMNVTMMSWGHGCGALRDFDYDPSCDFNKEAACINVNTSMEPVGIFHEDWYPIGDSSSVRMQSCYKPTFGEFYASTSNSSGPLTFGEVGLNEYREHVNSNRRAPDGAPVNLGYQNWWLNGTLGEDPVFTSSPDVTYSFTATQTSYIIASLDFPETNFDTRIYVLRDDGSNGGRGRSFGWRLDVNASNNRSVLSFHTLPAGDYFIVVEGQNSDLVNRGDFKLTLALLDTYESGTITHPTLTVPEGCVLKDPVITDMPAETSMGVPEYQWEYKLVSQTGWHDISGATSETLSGEELGPINEPIEVRRRLRTFGGIEYTNTLSFDIIEKSEPQFDGAISGKVTGPNGQGRVAGVSILVEAISEDDQLCQAETFITESNGEYLADNLYYGNNDGAITYRITPQYLDHQFDPPFETRTISSPTVRMNVDFEDTTTVFVRGMVYQVDDLNTLCPLPEVSFLKNDFPEPATSFSDGSYELAVTAGEFTFEADYLDGAHTFSPAAYVDVEVTRDTSGFDYESITTHTVSGSVMACGGFCYGGVELRLVDDYGCFDYLVETDDCGNFSTTLPARNYQLIVTNTDIGLVEGYDAQVIADFFAEDSIYADLSAADTTLTLMYEQTPIITLRPHTDSTGIQPIIGCEQDTVLAQGELTTLVFDIVESNTQGCPLDTGILMIVDEISGTDTTYHPISDGVAYYNVIPDTPYLFPFEPYQHLEFSAMSLDSQLVSSSETVRAIVTGIKARNASFATVSPEIPFLILRDPPGDESYAYFEESHTTDFNVSFSAAYGGSVTTWGKLKTGAKFEAGFLGFSTESEAWGEVGASATVSARNATDTDLTVSVTNSVAHSTDQSQNPNLVGAGGDLFVGAAMNLIFAKADVLEYDEQICQDTQVVDLIMGQDTFATQFVYTDFFIRTVEIPKLADLRDLGPPDSAWYYQDQIDMWEQTLARNEDLKAMAVPSESYPTNISFSGGSSTEYTTVNSTTTTIAYEFSLEVDAEISAEAGFEVAGSGVSGGVRSNFRVEIGSGKSSTDLRSRTTKFTLSDSEDQDAYTVDIRECPVYNTPVFNLVSATTSCPYTPNTVNRDIPRLVIDDPVRVDADPDGTEVFFLEIYNLSENDIEDSRDFVIDFIDVTNTNNATMNPDLRGTNKLEINVPYTPPGSSPEIVRIDVSNNNGSFDYENLTFVVYPVCDDISSLDPNTSAQASISIFYESPCSGIAIASPTNDYTVNSSDDDLLQVRLSDYTIAQLDDVEVQYTESGGATWTTGTVVTAAQLDPTTTDVDLDVSSLPDGLYDIRLKLNCAGGASFTQRVSSLIDRIAPIVFGIPTPIDDIYDQSANDEISVSFEEEITCVNASLLLTDMETLEVIPATLSCAGNQAMVVPDIVLDTRGPSIYRVTLGGLEDLNGNVREDYNWVFIVGDYIFDPDCSPLMLSNNNVDQDAISQSVYYSQQITTNGTIQEASTIEMVSEEGIDVNQGFTVEGGGVYEANIADCPND